MVITEMCYCESRNEWPDMWEAKITKLALLVPYITKKEGSTNLKAQRMLICGKKEKYVERADRTGQLK